MDKVSIHRNFITHLCYCKLIGWNEVCDIVQETVIKTIPNKKKCKKAKWLFKEANKYLRKEKKLKAKEKRKDIPI